MLSDTPRKAPRPLSEVIVLSALVIILDISIVVLGGYVFRLYWLWFIVPLGLPAISIAHAIGVRFLVSILSSPFKAESEDVTRKTGFERTFFKQVGMTIFILIYWVFGYVAHLFM